MQAGAIDEERTYTKRDFNHIIDIQEREHYRVQLFTELIDPTEKALGLCATQDHALAVCNLINQLNISPNLTTAFGA